jgi:hypothetical protein
VVSSKAVRQFAHRLRKCIEQSKPGPCHARSDSRICVAAVCVISPSQFDDMRRRYCRRVTARRTPAPGRAGDALFEQRQPILRQKLRRRADAGWRFTATSSSSAESAVNDLIFGQPGRASRYIVTDLRKKVVKRSMPNWSSATSPSGECRAARAEILRLMNDFGWQRCYAGFFWFPDPSHRYGIAVSKPR